jgi:MFS transporter, FHS family, L-fucose permease
LVRGVTALFFYCGAQVGVGSFVIRFVQHLHPGTPSTVAANYLEFHLFGFMIGRFSGSAIMIRFAEVVMSAMMSRASANA